MIKIVKMSGAIFLLLLVITEFVGWYYQCRAVCYLGFNPCQYHFILVPLTVGAGVITLGGVMTHLLVKEKKYESK